MIVDDDNSNISQESENSDDISDKQRHDHDGGVKRTAQMRGQVLMIIEAHTQIRRTCE